MYEVYIVTCGAHKDMVEPEKANGDRFFLTPEDAEKYLRENIIPEARKHYRVQTVIMYSEGDHKESVDNVKKIQNERDKIIATVDMLCELCLQNHRGAEETYQKIGETLIGKKRFIDIYNRFHKIIYKTKEN